MSEHSARLVLNVQDLNVAYLRGRRWLEAVKDLSLIIKPGETYGLVGESGSGKSTLVLAVMRYLGENGAIRSGQIYFYGQDLVALDHQQLGHIWGSQIMMVPQNPASSLNPSLPVGEQLVEVLRFQKEMKASAAQNQVIELLEKVHIPDPRRVFSSYPHQLSGGMQQRVMIAMAVSTEPDLLILDEPTSNLDVTTQAVILDLIMELIHERDQTRQKGVLYVTHNLDVVARISDRVGVMYAGELVEEAAVKELFKNPIHPYTQGLLNSAPRLEQSRMDRLLTSIPGQIPVLGERPSGCRFIPRCPLAIEICDQHPEMFRVVDGHHVRCHRWEDIKDNRVQAWLTSTANRQIHRHNKREGVKVLSLRNLNVQFPQRRTLRQVVRREPPYVNQAVAGVSLDIRQGETLGLVGESGSGKTTLARAVVGLVQKREGSIHLFNIELPARLSQRSKEILSQMQMVFQNPEEALNPFHTVGESLRRPLISLLGVSSSQADQQVDFLLKAVRLSPDYKDRLPGQLSGGEKQRLAIARAFATIPDLLIADEPVSSLDVSVQAVVLNLLKDLQVEHETSLLFISHDLAVVAYVADWIAVMYLGKLMEITDSTAIFEPPIHPYSETLLAAMPQLDLEIIRAPIRLLDDIPSPTELPSGCPFHPRCPRYLGQVCATEVPRWQIDDRTGKRYYCHIPPDKLNELQTLALNGTSIELKESD